MASITTPFGFHSTAAEVAAGIDLSGRRAIVTGGASGIGIEIARALAGAGAEVTLAVRDVDAGARTAAEITPRRATARSMSPVSFDDLDFAFCPYDPWAAYGQSKTANALFAVAASARWAGDGITVNSLTPGAIPTNLQRYIGAIKLSPDLLKTPEQGAATSVLLATSPLLEGIGGRYFADCNEGVPVTRRTDGDLTGVAPYALDADNAERLWDVSMGLMAA